jgi:hypothetical protein
MSGRSRRGAVLLLTTLIVTALIAPPVAQAHGIVGKADLPIPVWLFSWAAAIVLVVSFVALSTLWQRPQLQPGAQPGRVVTRLPRVLDWVAGLIGLGLFVLTVYCGFVGAQVQTANFANTFVYVVFWVGVPVLSVLFGDVFAAFNPWRAVGRLVEPLLRRGGRPLLAYPSWLGLWPAVGGIVGFAWLELVYVERYEPAVVAGLAVAYFALMLVGMALFGVEEWCSKGDGFGVYFNLLSRLAPLYRREDGSLCLRRPLSGVTGIRVQAGTVVFICSLIGTTTFDGFSNGGIWRKIEPSVESWISDLGLSAKPSLELAYSLGLVFCILLILAVYRVGIVGVRSVNRRLTTAELSASFVHTLVPIGFAYVLAHYFSLLLWQSQAIGYLISDPLGNGANIFGTAHATIDYEVISYAGIWYVQVAALLLGHVCGLALAHDRALVLYREPEEAVRSQYWMLAVMVAFTSFGLWLLSSVGT